MTPLAMTAVTAAPAASTDSKAARTTCAVSGSGNNLTVILGDDGEQAFRAGHQREQVIAGTVECLAANGQSLHLPW